MPIRVIVSPVRFAWVVADKLIGISTNYSYNLLSVLISFL